MSDFAENKWRFSSEEILYQASKCNVPNELVTELEKFLMFANSNESSLRYFWDYYKKLFLSDELIIPIEKVLNIEIPNLFEKNSPGLFATVIFLAAARNFEEYLKRENLLNTEFGFLDSYYKNVRRLMDMNYARDNTYAFIRLYEYLYGYAKPLILKIGRFAYELIQYENDLYDVYEKDGERIFLKKTEIERQNDLSGWDKVLSDGDYVITMHIPGTEKLTKEIIENSLKKAVPILKDKFKKYNPKKLVCTSWLLSPQLQSFLKEESNILRFQSYYDIAIWHPNDNSFYEHVFCSPIVPPDKLVPKNNFQQSVLDIYLNGGRLHDGFGIIKPEWQI